MSTLIERLKRENDAIRKEAREEAREEARKEAREEARKEMTQILNEKLLKEMLNLIVKMLKNGETDEKIKMYTNATDEQIEEGKRQLGIIV